MLDIGGISHFTFGFHANAMRRPAATIHLFVTCFFEWTKPTTNMSKEAIELSSLRDECEQEWVPSCSYV